MELGTKSAAAQLSLPDLAVLTDIVGSEEKERHSQKVLQ